MLIPMLGLLDISQASVSALTVLAAPRQRFSHALALKNERNAESGVICGIEEYAVCELILFS